MIPVAGCEQRANNHANNHANNYQQVSVGFPTRVGLRIKIATRVAGTTVVLQAGAVEAECRKDVETRIVVMPDLIAETSDLKSTPRQRVSPGSPHLLDRLPPHSLEAEQAVLGCILLSPNECMGECIAKLKGGSEAGLGTCFKKRLLPILCFTYVVACCPP